MRPVPQLSVALCVGLAMSCGGSGKRRAHDTSSADDSGVPTSSAPGNAIRPGLYEVNGRPVLDHCDDTLVFAADRLRLDVDGGSLVALFKNTPTRSYEIEERGAELLATGQFDPLPNCGTHQYIEVWRLRAAGADGIEGQLTAYYRDHRNHADCLQACKVVMAIKGSRVSD